MARKEPQTWFQTGRFVCLPTQPQSNKYIRHTQKLMWAHMHPARRTEFAAYGTRYPLLFYYLEY